MGHRDIKRRGGKIRLLTEIKSENINYCKQLMNIVDELRHLDGIKGGIALSETEFVATTMLEEATPLTQVRNLWYPFRAHFVSRFFKGQNIYLAAAKLAATMTMAQL